MLITIGVSGQLLSGKNSEKVTNTTIKLVEKISDNNVVILLDNKDYIVKVSLSDFKNYIDRWFKEYSIKDDKELLDIILKQSNNNIVNAAKIVEKKGYLTSRLEYSIAYLLENGKCLILSKKSNENISKIQLQTYNFYCGPECGAGGRRFYVDTRLIFEVMDWIS
jgi:uncharacterized protein YlzI (FlbEa/FlbD family)